MKMASMVGSTLIFLLTCGVAVAGPSNGEHSPLTDRYLKIGAELSTLTNKEDGSHFAGFTKNEKPAGDGVLVNGDKIAAIDAQVKPYAVYVVSKSMIQLNGEAVPACSGVTFAVSVESFSGARNMYFGASEKNGAVVCGYVVKDGLAWFGSTKDGEPVGPGISVFSDTSDHSIYAAIFQTINKHEIAFCVDLLGKSLATCSSGYPLKRGRIIGIEAAR
jgi:hypothetical protein